MRVLNLYAGIGGNRRLWKDVEVTAVEHDPEIAEIYRDLYPHDELIVGDAHQFLLENFLNYDFIWSSPPCPTHSCIRKAFADPYKKGKGSQNKPVYPDMNLYAEIIFLQNYFQGKFCVENVMPYYEPLIPAKKLGRHLFWTNFPLTDIKTTDERRNSTIKDKHQRPPRS